MVPSKPRCWVETYDAMRLLSFQERNLAVVQLKAIVHAGVPINACPAEKRKRESVPGTCRDELKELEDLNRALDNLNRPPRSPRSDTAGLCEQLPGARGYADNKSTKVEHPAKHPAEHPAEYRHLTVAGELWQRRCNCACAGDDPRCDYQRPRMGKC